jgi:hypothetical protein
MLRGDVSPPALTRYKISAGRGSLSWLELPLLFLRCHLTQSTGNLSPLRIVPPPLEIPVLMLSQHSSRSFLLYVCMLLQQDAEG